MQLRSAEEISLGHPESLPGGASWRRRSLCCLCVMLVLSGFAKVWLTTHHYGSLRRIITGLLVCGWCGVRVSTTTNGCHSRISVPIAPECCWTLLVLPVGPLTVGQRSMMDPSGSITDQVKRDNVLLDWRADRLECHCSLWRPSIHGVNVHRGCP